MSERYNYRQKKRQGVSDYALSFYFYERGET